MLGTGAGSASIRSAMRARSRLKVLPSRVFWMTLIPKTIVIATSGVTATTVAYWPECA